MLEAGEDELPNVEERMNGAPDVATLVLPVVWRTAGDVKVEQMLNT